MDHLNGLLYLDRLVGRYRREARRAGRDPGWDKFPKGGPFHWLPGTDNDVHHFHA